MASFIFILVLFVVMLLGVAILKVYKNVPAKELKRRVRVGDQLAKVLHGPVAYGKSLDILMWLVIAFSASVLVSMLANNLPFILAVIVIAGVLWFAFAWVPDTRVTKLMLQVTKFVSPAVRWLLEHLHPVLVRLGSFVEKHQSVTFHTGLYTKEDIIELIDTQKVQVDNRITEEELDIVKHALQFGDKTVAEVMTPRRMIKMVSSVDVIGPVLMGELHNSGYSRFPVYQDKEENIVGTLFIRDLVEAKAGGFVKTVMRKDVFYVYDQQSIARVLDAFIKTKHHMFLVVNNFEEIVGLITIEDVVEQVLGKQIIDEFDQYDDLRAVAHMEAEKDRQNRTEVVQSDQEEKEKDQREDTK